jgi:phytoene dehydrogenase-like protein
VSSYDAIVIGAGHNGLTCAAYLGRAGLRTLVVEATDRVGGACVTEELWPGFRASPVAYSLSLLQPDVIADLELALDVARRDPEVVVALDGGSLLLYEDRERRAEQIARLSADDARGYDELTTLFERAAEALRPHLSYPATRKVVRRSFRATEIEGLYKKTVTGAVADVCEEYLATDVMRGFVASQGIIGTSAGPRTPGTAYVYLHHSMGTAAGAPGAWGFVRGGMGEVSAQLAAAARRADAEIRLEAPVQSLLLAGRRVSGVTLESGEEIAAPVVCSSAHPHSTVRLVPDGALPPEVSEDVELVPTTGTAMRITCALGADPVCREPAYPSAGSAPSPSHPRSTTSRRRAARPPRGGHPSAWSSRHGSTATHPTASTSCRSWPSTFRTV